MATTIVMQTTGPLPLKGSFTLPDSPYPAALVVYGSCWSNAQQVLVGCTISVNGQTPTPGAQIFANYANMHMALVPGAVPIETDAADMEYTVELAPLGTHSATDANDHFLVVLYH